MVRWSLVALQHNDTMNLHKPPDWVDFGLGQLAGACCECTEEETIRAHPSAEGWQAWIADNSMCFGSCDVC